MARFRLIAAILAAIALHPPARAGEPRIADVRVGKHGEFERIVVELDAGEPVEVRWTLDPGGSDVFAIDARPLLARQVLASGRPLVGDMLLVAAPSGSELQLAPGARRTRAFLLEDPQRLVIDVAAAGDAPFEPPADVRAIARGPAVEPEPERLGAPPPSPPAVPEAHEPPAALQDTEADPSPSDDTAELQTAPEPAVAKAAPAARARRAPPVRGAPIPVPRVGSRLWSRALVLPLLAGAGVLMLALGGLALASAQRSRPGRRRAERAATPPPDPLDALGPLAADRLDLLEKRLDDEVRSRTQLEEQLAQTRAELANLRDWLARLRSQAAARTAAPSAPQ